MLTKVYEKLISEHIRQDPLAFSYAKNIVGAIFIALIASPFYALIYYGFGFHQASALILIEGFIVVAAVGFLNIGSLVLAREMIVGSLTICITWLSIYLGGVFTPTAFWLILPPLLAVFFGDRRASVYWGLCCILLNIFLYYNFSPAVESPSPNLLHLQVISISGLVCIILALAYFFEQGKRDAMREMQEANLKTQREQQRLVQISEANAMLTSILESSIEYSIIATDLEENILTWNKGAENNYGYKKEEMIGKRNILFLISPEEAKTNVHEQMIALVKETGNAVGIVERIRKNHEHFFALVEISLRKDANNQPLGYLVISKDITEKKLLEEQLAINKELDEQNRQVHETNRLKSAFLANMSHELRTPLTAILGFSELIHANVLGPLTEEQSAALKDIIASGKDLLRLIDSLLDLSKIELGKLEFKPKLVDLETLIHSVLGLFRPLFNKKKITCTFDMDKTISTIYTDPARLKQVLYNYLSNAIKFTPVKGVIHLCVKNVDEEMFRIEVKDTGIGIAAEDIKKLFVEFQQLDSSVRKKYAGTGLGLALVKHIVEVQGGKVGVTSTLGEGSTFYAILPKHYQETERPAVLKKLMRGEV